MSIWYATSFKRFTISQSDFINELLNPYEYSIPHYSNKLIEMNGMWDNNVSTQIRANYILTVRMSYSFHFYLFGSSDQTNNGIEISDSNAVNCKCRK
jgi:hypothetical protein